MVPRASSSEGLGRPAGLADKARAICVVVKRRPKSFMVMMFLRRCEKLYRCNEEGSR